MFFHWPKKAFLGKKVDRVKVCELKDPPIWSWDQKTWIYFEMFCEDEIVPFEEAEEGKADVAEENEKKRKAEHEQAVSEDIKMKSKKKKRHHR